MLNKWSKITILVIVFLLFNSSSAEARKRGFISFGGEAIAKVADFPDTETFQTEAGAYIDPGCIYKQFSIMFIPLWNYDLRWCGYTGVEDSYVEVDKATLDELAKEAKITLSAEPSLPFWEAIGGKLLFIALIAAFIAYSVLMKKREEVNSNNTSSATEETKEDEVK